MKSFSLIALSLFSLFAVESLHAQDPAEYAPVSFTVRLPHSYTNYGNQIGWVPFDCAHLTLCGLAVVKVPSSAYYCEPFQFMFSDGPVFTDGRDVVVGRWGYPTGAVFSGSVSVSTALVYTVAGTNLPQGYSVVSACPTTAVCTIAIPGGMSVTTSGVFDVLLCTGTTGATSISLTATGFVNVGMVALKPQQWFTAVPGWGGSEIHIGASVPTNAAYLSVDWTCTPTSNVAITRQDLYGVVSIWTNALPLSQYGCIKRGSQLRIPTLALGGLNTQTNTGETITYFGWRPVYTPAPLSDLWHTGNEINLRAEYNAKGYGQ
jgi:hypothetical protein